MLTPSTRPSFKMSADNSEQKVMWIMVSAIGYGNPEYDSTNLLYRMTEDESAIQIPMYIYDINICLPTSLCDFFSATDGILAIAVWCSSISSKLFSVGISAAVSEEALSDAMPQKAVSIQCVV